MIAYDGLYTYTYSFKSESRRNSAELSNFIWGKKKEKINVCLKYSILDKAKPYSPASSKCLLCLAEKYHIILSTKNLLNKRNEPVTNGRHEKSSILQITKTYHHNCFLLHFFQNDYRKYFLKVFHNTSYRLRIAI